MSWMNEVGEALRTARKARGLSQGELATQARLSRTTVARLETGRLPELGSAALQRLLQSVGLDLQVMPYNRGRPTLDMLAQEHAATEGGQE
jgi:transcriptional regulator with XRE-family HTH domain